MYRFNNYKSGIYDNKYLFKEICNECVSIYAGIQLWMVKKNAVKKVKYILIIFLIYGIIINLAPYLYLPSTLVNNDIAKDIYSIIGPIIYFTIWFTYLSKSKRVKVTYQDA